MANNLTVQQFIGPGSPNPNQQPYNKDFTSFGPAVGFAWQLPWFGKGKTTLRGGYQVSYTPIASSDPNGGYGAVIGNVAGTINPVTYSGDPSINSGYMNLATLQSLIPAGSIPTQGTTLANLTPPFSVMPVTSRGGTSSLGLNQYDPNIRNPYIQSLTMALTRNIGSNMTLDVRYIGTLSRKQVGILNLNSANWQSNGLLQALANSARWGRFSSVGQDNYTVFALVRNLTGSGSGARLVLHIHSPGTRRLCNCSRHFGHLPTGSFRFRLVPKRRRAPWHRHGREFHLHQSSVLLRELDWKPGQCELSLDAGAV